MMKLRSPKAIGATATAMLLLLLGGAFAWLRHAPDASALPDELSVASLKEKLDDPPALVETIRSNVRRDDLTDEQRQRLRQNVREVWRSALTERVDEYFDAPPDQADAVLDRHIDEFVKQMKTMREARERWRKEQAAEGRTPGQSPWRRGTRTQQERKTRSESRNPDRMARAMLYFNNLRARAAKRGIDLPRRGPGPRGNRRAGAGPGRRP